MVTSSRPAERGSTRSQNQGRSKSRSKKNMKCYNCGKKRPQGNVASTLNESGALSCAAVQLQKAKKEQMIIFRVILNFSPFLLSYFSSDLFPISSCFLVGSSMSGNEEPTMACPQISNLLKSTEGSMEATKRNKLVLFEGRTYNFDLEDFLRASTKVLGKRKRGKRLKDVLVTKNEFET
ncbi:unnamed protein product [Citrullus colocynthis]|uniref:Uncharacterized protein n=1 Tax=Citrullus colocynthis TaxID=252529 RepID=A0ABP0YDR9_9ROSI